MVGGKEGHITGLFPPCGVCRQVMQEFCGPDFLVYLGKENDQFMTATLEDLLPFGFSGSEHMN